MKTIVLANQKGGVGKTTSSGAIGFALAAKGARVLFVDTDAQRNLTKSVDPPRAAVTLTDLMLFGGNTVDAIAPVPEEASGKGIRADILQGASDIGRVTASAVPASRLRDLLQQVGGRYDYAVLDSPPAIGIMTVNAVAAADGVVIPTVAAAHSRDGIEQFLVNLSDIQERHNPALKLLGILITAYDGRAVIDRMVRGEIEAVASELGLPLLPVIRSTKYVREAEWLKESLLALAPKSTAARDYMEAADMIVSRLNEATPERSK